MSLKKIGGFLIAILFTFNLSAEMESQGEAKYVAATCPKISSEFDTAIAELKSMTSSVLKEAGCADVAEATRRIESSAKANHRRIIEIIRSKKGKMLDAASAEEIENYAATMTTTIADVFNLLGGSDCPLTKKNKKQIFRSLLTLSFEVIDGVSRVLGPYGAPLSVGVKALQGIVRGLFEYTDRRSGYKFEVSEAGRDQAVLYTKSLCVFYAFKSKADILLNASDRKNSYLNLMSFLNNKVDSLMVPGYCKGCTELEELMNASVATPESELTSLVEEINEENGAKIGTHLYDALKTRNWLIDQMSRLDLEVDDYSSSIGPAILGVEMKKLEDFLIYAEAKDFMNWIYKESRNSFGQFVKTSKNWVNFAALDLDAAERSDNFQSIWKSRQPRYSRISMPTLSLKDKPDYLTLYDFKEELISKKDILPKHSKFKNEKLVNSYYKRSVKDLKNVNRFLSAHNEYCLFFENAEYYDATYSECTSSAVSGVNEAFLRETKADPELSVWVHNIATDWEKTRLKIQVDREGWADHFEDLFDEWDNTKLFQIDVIKQLN